MAADESSPVTPEMRIRRPFNWGIVMICDERIGSPPPPQWDHAAVRDGGITVGVRHAQDVDLDGLADDDEPEPFEVEIVCWRGSAPRDATLGVVGRIAVPSGRLIIGDAERSDVVEVPPGDWLVEVSSSSAEHPGRLDVWLAPADAD